MGAAGGLGVQVSGDPELELRKKLLSLRA